MTKKITPQTTQETWQASLPEEWTVMQMDEHGQEVEIPLRDHPALRDYKTKDEAVKALVHAQRMLGKTPKGYIRIPDKDNTEEREALFATLGCPNCAEDYEIPAMEVPAGYEVKQQFIQEFKEVAHTLSLTSEQVAGLYQWFLPVVLDAHHSLEAETRQTRNRELESLRTVHRGDTPRMLDNALRAAEAIGGKELLLALDKTNAGDHAAVINAFAKMAPLVLESGMRSSGSGWGEELSRDKLREMMQDPRYHDPLQRDSGFVKKVRKGFEALYPGDYVPGSRV